MAQDALPVIILSTHSSKDAPLTIEALHRGAVDFIDKQEYSLVDFNALRAVLVEKILQVAGVRPHAVPAEEPAAHPAPVAPDAAGSSFDALLIGASTGGPPAIQRILEDLEGELPVPAAVVQHMPPGFTRAFADRLNTHLPFPVREAAHGDVFAAGTVFIAPSGRHLRLRREGERVLIALSSHPDNVPHRPSADILFASSAAVFGPRAVAVLLTGMGRDGAEGMEDLAKAGAYTLAQDEATCVVYGMPRAAVLAGAVKEQLPIRCIGGRLIELIGGRKSL